MTTVLQSLVNAVTLGSVYSLIAVGIGLVFGVMRLINFAYGQLIMVGAFALAVTVDWPVAASIVVCFATVVVFSLAMELMVFRPLRTASPATMLVTTFAVSFLLQAIALVKFGTYGRPANSLAQLAWRPLPLSRWPCCSTRPRSGCSCARPRSIRARRGCSVSRRMW
jgi:branched-chain amino acid transport system permease protein